MTEALRTDAAEAQAELEKHIAEHGCQLLLRRDLAERVGIHPTATLTPVKIDRR